MSELIREPTDAEFSALMDNVSPDRNLEPDNQPAPEAPVVAEATPEAPPQPDELPEKYRGKTPAEIVRMHQEAESRLGQQGQELGELRALRGEFEQFRTELNAPAPEPAPWENQTFAYDRLDEQVLTDPKGTLDWITTNQPQLYDRAVQTWAQLDPFAASSYDTQQKIAAVERKHAEELAAVRAPVVQSQNDAMLSQAYTNVANTNPMLEQYAPDFPALLEDNPEFKILLSNGDVATRERALNNLVAIAAVKRGSSQGAPAETAAQAAHQAKLSSTVASSGSSAERGGQSGESSSSRMLASEGTSVAEELARNRAAAVVAGQRRA